jgi:hypothetical protein
VGTPDWRRVRATAAVSCLVLVAGVMLGGCDGGATTQAGSSPAATDATPTASTPPATPTADREAADRSAVEAAYRQFWVVVVTFDQRYPEREWPTVLGRVAVDPELGLVLASTRQQRRNGIKVYGSVIPRPTVLPINGSNRAQVTDCQDASKSGQADAKTGQPRTVGVPRNPVTAVLVRRADGRWRVSSIKHPGATC